LRKLKNQYKHPDLYDIDLIYSSNGVSIRPKVKMNFIMDQFSISANVNITSRDELKYAAIIGKKNLGKFLIDVNK